MWEVFTYGNGEFLRLIFNALAAIFATNDYLTALKTVVLIGLLVVMTQAAFFRGQINLQWIMGAICIYFVLFIPKVNVAINDRIIPSNNAVVNNVPFGVALFTSGASKVGDWLTRSFEVVFSLPSEVSYAGNGLLFANHLVEESLKFEIRDERLATNLSSFWKSCVYYDLLLNRYSFADLSRSTNLNNFFQNNVSQTRYFDYLRTTNSTELLPCRAGYVQRLSNDLAAEVNAARTYHAGRLLPDLNTSDAIAKYSGSMPMALSHLTGISLSASQSLSQVMLANSFKRGVGNFANSTDAAAAAQELAAAKAEAEREMSYSVLGKIAKRYLPILRNIFEAMVYAIAPVVFLLMMLPIGGKVVIGYLRAVGWIALWPPLYVILHFIITFYSQSSATALVDGSGLVMANYTALKHSLEQHSVVAGYLTMSIPLIAWMVVQASGAMMAGVANRALQGYDSAVQKSASEVSSGNISMGQLSYQNQSAFSHNTSPSMNAGFGTSNLGNGMERTVTTGGNFVDFNQSSTPLSMNLSSGTSTSARNYLEETQQKLFQAESNYMDAVKAVGQQLYSAGTGRTDGTNVNNTYATGSNEEFRESEQQMFQQLQNHINERSSTNSNTEELALAAAGHLGFNVSALGASAGVSGSITRTERWAEINAEALKYAESFAQTDTFQTSLSEMRAAREESLGTESQGYQYSSRDDTSSSFEQLSNASYQLKQASQEAERAGRLVDHVESEGFTSSMNNIDSFLSWSEDKTFSGGFGRQHVENLLQEAQRNNPEAMAELQGISARYSQEAFNEQKLNFEQEAGRIEGAGLRVVSAQHNENQTWVKESRDYHDGDVSKADRITGNLSVSDIIGQFNDIKGDVLKGVDPAKAESVSERINNLAPKEGEVLTTEETMARIGELRNILENDLDPKNALGNDLIQSVQAAQTVYGDEVKEKTSNIKGPFHGLD